jgi:hypothetical protein
MGKNSKAKKSKGGKSKAESGEGWIMVDPNRIRFQHSRIRPYFSGCGRSVVQTLEDIREGKLKPEDLPPIQVLVGPEEDGQRWYFSLNNRRLWVLKRCREDGLLTNNEIRARVREPKSDAELERYTLENCALEAKFTREQKKKNEENLEVSTTRGDMTTCGKREYESKDAAISGGARNDDKEDEMSDEAEEEETLCKTNPFDALL